MSTETVSEIAAADAAAVRAVPGRIIAAWADNNAAAFAEVFTEDGSMILPGVHITGRDAIREFMTAAFAGPYQGTNVTGTPVAVKYLAEDVVLVITKGGVLKPGVTELDEASAVKASWLLVKRNGDWLLTAYQNTPANN